MPRGTIDDDDYRGIKLLRDYIKFGKIFENFEPRRVSIRSEEILSIMNSKPVNLRIN